MTESTKYTGEVGCLVGGHEGQYAVISVIDIASAYGMELTDEDQAIIDAYLEGYGSITHNDNQYDTADYISNQGGLADHAENWLNENVAEDGFSFGWSDGEFFYMEDGWWEYNA